jgi:CRP/FNR family cyclic AMP-dependent transcriptional regulator
MRKALYILGDLDDGDILWMSRNGENRALSEGEVLIQAGREVTELYFVTDGNLEVTTRNGQKLATLALGDAVGEMSFVEKRLPGASVTALDHARVLAIPRRAILEEFDRDSGFAARFYRALAVFLSDRLRTATAQDGSDELDEGVLDTLHQAGDRFTRLIALLDGRER